MHAARSYKLENLLGILGVDFHVSLGTIRDGNVTNFSNFLGSGRVNKSFIYGVCSIVAKARQLLLDLSAAQWTYCWCCESRSTRAQLTWIACYCYWDIRLMRQEKDQKQRTHCKVWCLHFGLVLEKWKGLGLAVGMSFICLILVSIYRRWKCPFFSKVFFFWFIFSLI